MREKRVRSPTGEIFLNWRSLEIRFQVTVLYCLFLFNLGVQSSPFEIRLSVDNSMSVFGHYI